MMDICAACRPRIPCYPQLVSKPSAPVALALSPPTVQVLAPTTAAKPSLLLPFHEHVLCRGALPQRGASSQPYVHFLPPLTDSPFLNLICSIGQAQHFCRVHFLFVRIPIVYT